MLFATLSSIAPKHRLLTAQPDQRTVHGSLAPRPRQIASAHEAPVVGKNQGMIEHQIQSRIARIHQANSRRVVTRPELATAIGNEHDADSVSTRIPTRIRIDTQQRLQLHLQPGFLQSLSHSRLFDTLTNIDKPARQSQTARRVTALHEHNPLRPLLQTNNDIRGNRRRDNARHKLTFTQIYNVFYYDKEYSNAYL